MLKRRRNSILLAIESGCILIQTAHIAKECLTLLTLQSQGIYVEALQVDDADIKKSQYPIPVRKAQKAEVKDTILRLFHTRLLLTLKESSLSTNQGLSKRRTNDGIN